MDPLEIEKDPARKGIISKKSTEIPQILVIQIRLPNGHWAGDLTRAVPHLVLRIDEHMPLVGGRGSAKVSIVGQNISNCLDFFDKYQGIEAYTVYKEAVNHLELNVTIAKKGGGFIKAVTKATIAPRTPFEVRDGWAEWEFVTDQEHARSLINSLKENLTPHKVVSFSHLLPTRLLTPRQREVFELALSEGFYETPRRTNLTKLAAILGISKSTVCELVQHIEHHIINEYRDLVLQNSPLN